MKRINTIVCGLFISCASLSAQEIFSVSEPQALSPELDKQSYGYCAVFSNDTLFVSGATSNIESIVDSYVVTSNGAKKIGTIYEGGVKARPFFGSKVFASGGRLGVLASTAKYFYLYEKSATGVSTQPVDSISRAKANMFVDLAGKYYVTSEACTLKVQKLTGNKHMSVFARGTNTDAPCAMDETTLCYIDTELGADRAVADTLLRIVEDPEEAFKTFNEAHFSSVSLAGYGGFTSLAAIGLDIKNGKIAVGLSSGCLKVLIIEKLSSGWSVTHVIEKQEDIEKSWGHALCFDDENSLAIGCNKSGDAYIYKYVDGLWTPTLRLVSDIEHGFAVAYNGKYCVSTNNIYKGKTGELSNCGVALLFNISDTNSPILDLTVDIDNEDGELYDLYGRKIDDSYKGLVVKDGRLLLKK